MDINHDISLKPLNTFGIDVKAKQYFEVNSTDALERFLKKSYTDEFLILGGGSNVLLIRDLDKTALHINIKGKAISKETADHVFIEAMAGENWHAFVRYCVENGFGGIENLSLIPGNVGTAPIQNIGAYGVELKDVFVKCKAIHRQTLEKRTFYKADCQFGYRDSIFKNALKNQYVITSVVLKLSKKDHQLHTRYGSLQRELKTLGRNSPSIRDISDAVIQIRQRKLPNPQEIGNSGSFFKNPVIPKAAFTDLKKKFPKMPFYELDNNQIKVPAGWLIDQAGFKGYRQGDAGVHKDQALVLVNYGNASGQDILNLARKIQTTIQAEYGLYLEMEVNVID